MVTDTAPGGLDVRLTTPFRSMSSAEECYRISK